MDDALTGWPRDLISVFAALGNAMGEQQLRPEIIERLSGEDGAIVEGHTVKVVHSSGREIGDKRGRYIIELHGVRWVDGGRWTFVSGDLEKLSRAAVSAAK
jgi:hypothetical protein